MPNSLKKSVKRSRLKVIHFKLRLTAKLVAPAKLSIRQLQLVIRLSFPWGNLLPFSAPSTCLPTCLTPSRHSESCLNFLVVLSTSEITGLGFLQHASTTSCSSQHYQLLINASFEEIVKVTCETSLLAEMLYNAS